jgi:hypothetical protein
MGYTNKPETNAVTVLSFTCMAQRNRADDGVRATESKFYLPAGGHPSFVASRLESVWATLFNHDIETSR